MGRRGGRRFWLDREDKGEVKMKINCLSCGHSFDISDAYDDYTGYVKCWICGSLLMIRTEAGILKSLKIAVQERVAVVQSSPDMENLPE